MTRVVCKFGGTSLADARQFQKVASIIKSDPRRRVIVPSAPGKRNPQDVKLTDLLYLCQQTAAVGSDFSAVFERISDRFLEIERDLRLSSKIEGHLADLKAKIAKGVSKDLSPRGENTSMESCWPPP